MIKNNAFQCSAGFTLIEVLIALMLLAIALTAAIFAVQMSVRGTEYSKDKLAAHWVAMNIISSMQVGLIRTPNQGTQQGEAQMLQKKFSWRAGIEQQGNDYYERIYIDVSLNQSSMVLEHWVGFLPLKNLKNDTATLP